MFLFYVKLYTWEKNGLRTDKKLNYKKDKKNIQIQKNYFTVNKDGIKEKSYVF